MSYVISVPPDRLFNTCLRTVLICFLSISVFTLPQDLKAQCNSTGAKSGGVFIDDNSGGVFTMQDPNNARISDDLRVTAVSTPDFPDNTTHYLRISGFGFFVPST